jgi:hypothetical protein
VTLVACLYHVAPHRCCLSPRRAAPAPRERRAILQLSDATAYYSYPVLQNVPQRGHALSGVWVLLPPGQWHPARPAPGQRSPLPRRCACARTSRPGGLRASASPLRCGPRSPRRAWCSPLGRGPAAPEWPSSVSSMDPIRGMNRQRAVSYSLPSTPLRGARLSERRHLCTLLVC